MKKIPSKGIVYKAIVDAMGNLTVAAKALHCERVTLYRWIDEYGLKDAVQEGRDRMLDIAENQLAENIQSGKEVSLIFFLKTQGRSRGYSEKVDVEHTGKDGGAIQFDVKQMTTDELRKIISSARDSITRIGSQTDD
jgi:hypothetical protein